MRRIQELHDCRICAYKRKYLDVEIDQIDLDVYMAISTKVSTCIQAAAPNALETMENILSNEEKENHFKRAFAALDDAKALEIEWWMHMIKKYDLKTDKAFVDSENRKFYVCLDSCGKFQTNFKLDESKVKKE